MVLVTLASCGKNESGKSNRERSQNPVTTENSLTDLMNKHRRSIGLRALKYNLQIEDVAVEHSAYMATGGAFGHGGWRSRCARLRVEFGANNCGEIVAMGQATPEAVLRAWLNSPPHRRAIENPEFTHTGIGIAKNRYGRIYWTQLFLKIQ